MNKQDMREEVESMDYGAIKRSNMSDFLYISREKVLKLIDQLDEPEVLSHEWIKDNQLMWTSIHGAEYYVPANKLYGKIVPKQKITEEQAWEVIHDKYGDELLQNNIGYVESKGYVVSEKPVIPARVARYMKDTPFGEVIRFGLNDLSDELMSYGIYEWMKENEKGFVEAYINGYEIEKEKLYRVQVEVVYLAKSKAGKVIETVQFVDEDRYKYELTEQEIKDYDERFWAFAEEVEE